VARLLLHTSLCRLLMARIPREEWWLTDAGALQPLTWWRTEYGRPPDCSYQ